MTAQQSACFSQVTSLELLRRIRWAPLASRFSESYLTEAGRPKVRTGRHGTSHRTFRKGAARPDDLSVQQDQSLGCPRNIDAEGRLGSTDHTSEDDPHRQGKEEEAAKVTSQRLLKVGNFDGALAMVSGLNSFGVQRIQQLWSSLDVRTAEDFARLDALFLPVANFRNYNAAVSEHRGPIIPYVGVFLRDLTFIAENKTMEDDNIHFDVCRDISARCDRLISYQSIRHRLTFPVR